MKTSVPAEQSEFLILWVDFHENLRFCRAPLETTRLDSREQKNRTPREF
jgi:hypothetical protein